MKWYLIWFLTVTLPHGSGDVNTSEARMMMRSKLECEQAMLVKKIEQEGLLGTTRWVSHGTIAPYGGKGEVTGITVGCVQR